MNATEELTPEAKAALDKIEHATRKGFNLRDRLQSRGLRKGSIVLYLDEELGPELGWVIVNEKRDLLGNLIETKKIRVGVLGQIDELEDKLAEIESNLAEAKRAAEIDEALEVPDMSDLLGAVNKQLEALAHARDDLVAELTRTGLTIHIRAVPKVIEKATLRKAREHLGITEKGVPDDKQDAVSEASQAFLMVDMIQTITDNQTGIVQEGVSYEEAIDLMGNLPAGQWARLDSKLGEIQFVDGISLAIESQEDFS